MYSLFKPFVTVSIALVLVGCKQPTDSQKSQGGDPIPGPFLDVALTLEKVPRYQEPARLVYDVTFVGKHSLPLITMTDSLPLVTHEGDTAHYLWLYFRMDRRTQLLSANPDSVWHDKVDIGQKILGV